MITVIVNDSIKSRLNDVINKAINEASASDGLYFVVPESIKACVERCVLGNNISKCVNVPVDNSGEDESKKTIVNGALINGDVLSIIRLAVRILEMTGNSYTSSLNDPLLRNVIYKILVDKKEEFKVISRFARRLEYIDIVIRLLGDFVRYNMDYSVMTKAYVYANNDASVTPSYLDKIHDIALLMNYIEEYNEKYNLKLLQSTINQANKVLVHILTNPEEKKSFENYELMNFLKNRFVFIGFGVDRLFTPEELSFIENLSKLGADIIINPLSDGSSSEDNEYKIYYYGNKTVEQLAKLDSVDIIDETSNVSSVDYDISTWNGISGNYIFDSKEIIDINSMPEEERIRCNDLILSEFKDVDDRIAYIANEIIRLTRNEGYRYKDIRIVCVNDDLIPRLKSVLSVFGLEGFIDQKIALDNTPVLRYVYGILQLPMRGYCLTDVLSLLRTKLFTIPYEYIDLFENYCIEKNITWKDRIFNEDFYQEDSALENRTLVINGEIKTINNVGKYIWKVVVEKYLLPIYALCQELENNKNISDKASFLAKEVDSKRKYITFLRNEMIKRKETDEAAALVVGYKEVLSLLTTFMNEINDTEISIENFANLIRMDMSNKASGTIPLKVDSIDITSPSMSFLTPCKVMFIVGAEENNFPYKKVNDTFMNGTELKKLFGSVNIEYQDRAENQNRKEYIEAALLLNSVSDKFYYVQEFGKSESSVYRYLKLFVQNKDINYNNFKSPVYGNSVERRHDHKKSLIEEKVMLELLSEEMHTSVSALQEFNTCNMRYMLDKILKIRPRFDGTVIKSNHIGEIAHAMLEFMFKRVKKVCNDKESLLKLKDEYKKDSEVLSDLIDECYDVTIEKIYLPDKETDEFTANFGNKVKRIARKAFVDLVDECVELDYLPDEFELRVETLDNVLEYVTTNDIKFKFKGSIDRVDRKIGDSDRVRIIDYKTGPKKFEYKELAQGVQIQLPAYANALKLNNYEVDSMGYAQIGLKAEDNDLSLKISTKGLDLSTDETAFNEVLKYTNGIIKRSCNEITHGKSTALVAFKNSRACEYCDYRGMCGNSIAKPKMMKSKVELPTSGVITYKKYQEAISAANLKDGE